MLNGFRFSIIFGPNFNTNNKYTDNIESTGHGVLINGHESTTSSVIILYININHTILVVYSYIY